MAPEPLILDGTLRLVRGAGSGGTANVYLAEEVATGRKVAVKVLRPNLAGRADMLGRFVREATLLSRLEHPNIVRLLRYEAADEGVLLVLEWVEGKRLDEALNQGPMAAERVLSILRQLASALAAIHVAGVVHRDLKPGNVMLEGAGDDERVRLLDFGIARFSDPVLAKDLFQSAVGHLTGTPAFMAPEQAAGRPTDARTDVYTFGVLAYLLISGRLPFKGKNDYDTISQQLDREPPALEPQDPSLNGSKLVALVMRCLEKKPAARPADGRALCVELDGDLTSPAPKKRSTWF